MESIVRADGLARDVLESLLATVADGVVVCDVTEPDQPVVYVNERFEQITGYPADEVLGRNCRLLQGRDTNRRARAQIREAVAAGRPVTTTLLNYRRDGSTFWSELRLSPVSGVGGTGSDVRFYLGLIADVSERVGAVFELARAEAVRSSVFGALHEGVLVLGPEGEVVDVNPSALAILGVTREQFARRDWWDTLHVRRPDGRPLSRAESPGHQALDQQRRLSDRRLLMRGGDGEDRLVSLNYEPLSVPGRPPGLVVSFRDETERQRVEEELQQLASLVEASDDFIAIAGLDGRVRYINEAGRRLVGLESAAAVPAVRVRDLYTEAGWERSLAAEQPAVRAGRHWRGEGELRHFGTGEPIPVRISSYLVCDPDSGEPLAMATVRRDISEERRATEDVVRSRRRYQAQFRSLPLPTYVWQRQDDDFVLVEYNAAAIEVTRGDVADLLRARAREVFADAPEVVDAMQRCWATRSHVTIEHEYQMVSTGEPRHLIATYAWVPDDLVLIHTLDITRRVESEQELQRLVERDDLTGLHNRRFFEARLTEALGARDVAVLILDVDHFKFVNDSLGHGAGDELLREVAATMTARLREGDVLARFGGDEFVVLLDGGDDRRARVVANHLLAAIRSCVTGVSVTASCGAAVFRRAAGVTASDALVAADIALYQAKERGRDRMELYSGQTGESLTWLEQIRTAIGEDRLVLHGQPVIDLRADDATPTYELLVRMAGEDGRIIPPASFLPTAEQFGLIREIDRWVVEQGISLAARGNRVSINLSARSLGDPDLADVVAETLARTGAPPEYVTFEFTETAAVSSMEDAQAFTARLVQLGCWTALDDFGTGFATFVLLKHLPVNALKIDREFVVGLSRSEADQRIVQAIVRIARDAGLRTVAEGVEDAGALALLRQYGVDYAQGFHIGRPGPIPE